MAMEVKGVHECIQQLSNIVGDVKARKAVRAIHSALIIGSTRAALYTPIGKTSNLINSQYREMYINGTLLTGRVGYSANYAAYVHDPNKPMKFRRTTAQKEFLTKGFGDEINAINEAIYKEMSL